MNKNQIGEAILKVENIPISHIGTDPAQAADMANRTVATPAHLDIGETSFALALGAVVEKTVKYIYDQKQPPMTEAERQAANGNMKNELRKDLAYKVRPLNGVWATPPYLHNASVPTIDDLLGDPKKTGEILSRQPRIRPREARLQDRPDHQRLRIRHLPFAATRTGATNSGRTTTRTRKSRA